MRRHKLPIKTVQRIAYNLALIAEVEKMILRFYEREESFIGAKAYEEPDKEQRFQNFGTKENPIIVDTEWVVNVRVKE